MRRIYCLPVVAEDSDGAAAQADEDIEARKIEAKESSDGGGSSAAGGHDAVAALVRGRGGDRRSGPWHGGSKGLRGQWLGLKHVEDVVRTMSTEATTTESLENMFV